MLDDGEQVHVRRSDGQGRKCHSLTKREEAVCFIGAKNLLAFFEFECVATVSRKRVTN